MSKQSMIDSKKQEKSTGNPHFGENDKEYANKLARESIEDASNQRILFFKPDYDKSHRNFYEEFTIIKFENPKGTELFGIIDIEDGEREKTEGIVRQSTKLTFSVHVDQLKEKDIEPKIGDYFSYKNKFYWIFNKTAPDADKNTLGADREKAFLTFYCSQADDEQIFADFWTVQGTQNQIEGKEGYEPK